MSPPEDIVIRLLFPDEAARLVELIRCCYGETYVDPTFMKNLS